MTLAEPLVVVWRVFSGCNLSCKFCGYARDIAPAAVMANPQEVLRVGKLLAEFQEQTGRRTHLSFLGGEPLLWAPIQEIITKLYQEYGLSIGMTTNGTPLSSSKNRDFLIRNIELLTVSVDGSAAFHDSVRKSTGLYDTLRKTIASLNSENVFARLRIRINTVLMHQNIRVFRDFCQELSEWGIDSISFNQLGGRERPEFFEDHRLTVDDVAFFRASLPKISRELATKNIKLLGSELYLKRMAASASNVAVSVPDCSAGYNFLFIDEAGLIAPCSFTVNDFSTSIASIREVEQILALAQQFSGRQRTGKVAACSDCHSTQFFGKFTKVNSSLNVVKQHETMGNYA